MKHLHCILINSYKYLAVTVTIFLLFIILAGCSNDKKEAAITYVLKQIYQTPDLELVHLSDQMIEEIEKASKTETEYNLENSEFFTSIAKRYEEYMTPEYYEKMISRQIPYKYHLLMTELGYTMKVQDINITKNKRTSNSYDFVMTLSFGPEEGENSNLEIQGSAQFEADSNRINYLNLLDNNLTDKLIEKSDSFQ